MAALLLYAVTAPALVLMAARAVRPITRIASAVLIFLPLVVTGEALLTGGVYGPIDLAYQTEPLASFSAEAGVEGIGAPTLTDVHRLMIPWRAAVRDAFRNGEWPLWNRYSFTGEILAAGSEAAPWHPINLLTTLLPASAGVTFHATAVLLAAALAMFLFVRELEIGETAALFAAAAWMLSPFLLFFVQVPLGSTVLMQPLILLAVRRVVHRTSRADTLLLTVSLGVSVVAGHPESTLHVVAVGVAYALYEMVASHRRAPERTLHVLGAGVAAGVLALLLSAIHLFPFLEALPQTSDFAHRSELGAATSLPLGAALHKLATYPLPFVLGSPNYEDAHVDPRLRQPSPGYVGSVLFAPAILALLRWRDRTRWFLIVLAIVGFLAGASFPGVPEILAKLPLFDIALNERLVFGAVLAVAVLGAAGIDLWLRTDDRALGRITLGILIVLGAATALFATTSPELGLSAGYIRSNAVRTLVPVALAAAIVLQRRASTRAAAAILLLLVLQRYDDRDAVAPTIPSRAFYPKTPLLAALPDSEEPYRVIGRTTSMIPNTSIHHGIEDPRGFTGMTLARQRQTIAAWSRWEPVSFNVVDDLTRPMLSFLNVRYAIQTATEDIPRGWVERIRWRGGKLLENSNALPRAFIPSTIREEGHVASAVESMKSLTDFRELAFIGPELGGESATPAQGLGKNGTGLVNVARRGSGLAIKADLASDAWVVISNTAWPGWKAEIDEKPAPLFYGNVAWLALRVPAGRHSITLRYRPASFYAGLTISAATLLALTIVGMIQRRRNLVEVRSSTP